jgi:hypothetical protein
VMNGDSRYRGALFNIELIYLQDINLLRGGDVRVAT